MGLFSRKCPKCGSKEHSLKDCPHSILYTKCPKCESKEHTLEECPHSILYTKCPKCGSKNHSLDDCPHSILYTKCPKCGSKEHSLDDCPHSIFYRKCAYCKSKDHSTDNCPNGGCFITTATLLSIGKSDDCNELNTFRYFRDNWLLKEPDGDKLISEYYLFAPRIVKSIDSLKNSKVVYITIWESAIFPCLKLINQNRMKEAKSLYCEVVLELKQKYLTD